MFKSSILVLSTSFVLAAACSGAPGTFHDACNDVASTACDKLFQCVAPDVIKQQLGYTDANDCTIKLQAQANCANITNCPSGTTYSSANASTCINDIKTAACIQTVQNPPSCNTICE